MDSRKILQADYLDIVYERHNKNYGGYQLRKDYDRRLKKGLFSLLFGVAVLCSFSFVRSGHEEHVRVITVYEPKILDIPKAEPRVQPEKPAPAPPHAKVKTKLFTDPVITRDPISPDQQLTNVNDLKHTLPGNTNNPDGDSADVAPVITGKHGTGIVEPPAAVSKPFVYVEQMPQFIGAMDAYLSSHLNYPAAARENNKEGKVVIQFVVNEDGSVTGATVVKSVGGGCDEEAMRMVSNMPKWKPGRQNGVPVKVLFTLPIKFVLH